MNNIPQDNDEQFEQEMWDYVREVQIIFEYAEEDEPVEDHEYWMRRKENSYDEIIDEEE